MRNQITPLNRGDFLLNNGEPYCYVLPELGPAPSESNRPRNRKDKLWCWFYYLDLIQNHPLGARWVLDNLDKIPSFKANWDSFNDENMPKKHKYRRISRREPKPL